MSVRTDELTDVAVNVRPAAYGRPRQTTLRRPQRRFRVPESRAARVTLGVALLVGGLLGFLPILGFWMIPLGLYVLSHDFPRVLRFRRRATVWLGRHWQRHERRPAVQRALVKLGLR